VAGLVFYRYMQPRFHAVAVVLLSIGFMVTALIVRLLLGYLSELGTLASGLTIIGIAAGVVVVLYRLRASMGGIR